MTEAATSAPSSKPATEKVKMTDGREVEFTGPKKKMIKVALHDGTPLDEIEDGVAVDTDKLAVRFDFRNGTTRTYPLNPSLLARFAAHGALQKYGDNLAGGVKNADGSESEDLDDWAEAQDELHTQLTEGKWRSVREGSGFGGQSVLLKAICEVLGKDTEVVRAYLKDRTPKEKLALRMSAKFAPTIKRLEAEKAQKATANIDTEALLAELN